MTVISSSKPNNTPHPSSLLSPIPFAAIIVILSVAAPLTSGIKVTAPEPRPEDATSPLEIVPAGRPYDIEWIASATDAGEWCAIDLMDDIPDEGELATYELNQVLGGTNCAAQTFPWHPHANLSSPTYHKILVRVVSNGDGWGRSPPFQIQIVDGLPPIEATSTAGLEVVVSPPAGTSDVPFSILPATSVITASLSPGAIAGITVGVVVLTGVILTLGLLVLRYRRHAAASPSKSNWSSAAENAEGDEGGWVVVKGELDAEGTVRAELEGSAVPLTGVAEMEGEEGSEKKDGDGDGNGNEKGKDEDGGGAVVVEIEVSEQAVEVGGGEKFELEGDIGTGRFGRFGRLNRGVEAESNDSHG